MKGFLTATYNSRPFAILLDQVNGVKWGSVTDLEELFGDIWGQSGRAMQMLGFSTTPNENNSIDLEKGGIWFSSMMESTCGVPNVFFADT